MSQQIVPMTISPATDDDLTAIRKRGKYNADWPTTQILLARIEADAVERKRLEDALETEREIVNRIWRQLGITDYESARGMSIYELIEELQRKASLDQLWDKVNTLGGGPSSSPEQSSINFTVDQVLSYIEGLGGMDPLQRKAQAPAIPAPECDTEDGGEMCQDCDCWKHTREMCS